MEEGYENGEKSEEAFDTLEALLASIQTPEDAHARLLYLESKVEEYAAACADIENMLYGPTRPKSPLVVSKFEDENTALKEKIAVWEGWYDIVLQLFPKNEWPLRKEKTES